MPWCPKCKYEYVEGIKICPDCKTALVESLDDVNDEELIEDDYEFDESEDESAFEEVEENLSVNVMELVKKVQNHEMTVDEFNSIINELRGRTKRIKPYDYKKDRLTDNSSSAKVLLVIGIMGIAALVLNLLGIFHLPIGGASHWLIYVVMGGLFLIFVLGGIMSVFKTKKLKPIVAEEERFIEECKNFLIEKKNAGYFKLDDQNISYEEESLIISEMAISALEEQYDNLEEGFAYFVADRYFSEIFEDEAVSEE